MKINKNGEAIHLMILSGSGNDDEQKTGEVIGSNRMNMLEIDQHEWRCFPENFKLVW